MEKNQIDSKQQSEIAVLGANYINMSKKIDDLEKTFVREFSDFKKELRSDYVTKESFYPVKAVVYWLVSIILVAIISLLVNAVLVEKKDMHLLGSVRVVRNM